MDQICISIDMEATGRKIRELLYKHGYTVHDVQTAMGFNNPQAVYKWLTGKALPSVDNLLILSRLLNESINNILVTDEDIPMSGEILCKRRFFHYIFAFWNVGTAVDTTAFRINAREF